MEPLSARLVVQSHIAQVGGRDLCSLYSRHISSMSYLACPLVPSHKYNCVGYCSRVVYIFSHVRGQAEGDPSRTHDMSHAKAPTNKSFTMVRLQ